MKRSLPFDPAGEVAITAADRDRWQREHPCLQDIMAAAEVFWFNPRLEPFERCRSGLPLTRADVDEAEGRLVRFAPYLADVFPSTRADGGLIESPLIPLPSLQRRLEQWHNRSLAGALLLKADNLLAISGSIKARGGMYEVLKHAEGLALESGLLRPGDDYRIFGTERLRRLFAAHAIAVGSTGNLGLSIGIIGRQLGFRVIVHMSAEAREWKKALLREKGAEVVEHGDDYGQAVAAGRRQAEADRRMHFIDDEHSVDLFLGYAVAAGRLQRQLLSSGITVDSDHPLTVFLPCGVGGGPGGIAFGLKLVFGDHVHCYLAEPVQSPCLLLGLLTGRHDRISVRDFGLNNRTEADGLAVARPSGFVCRMLDRLISGVFTVSDDTLCRAQALLAQSEQIRVEPSAAAGLPGPFRLQLGEGSLPGSGLGGRPRTTHLVWATGGSMVPEAVMADSLEKGMALLRREQR